MIEVLSSDDHVLALRLSGTLTGDDFDRAAAEVDARLARHDKVGVFVDLTGFHDLTPDAVAKDLRFGFSKIGQWKRFPREAVLTDKQWIKALVKLLDPVIPSIEVQTFDPSQREAALAWAGAFQKA